MSPIEKSMLEKSKGSLDWQNIIQTMTNPFSKEDVKTVQEKSFQILHIKKIDYGLQIEIQYKSKKAHVRLYQNKKTGLRLDLSLIKEEKLKKESDHFFRNCLKEFLKNELKENETNQKPNKKIKRDKPYEPCIGTDESGKGDYFGPLVVSAVYVNEETIELVEELGVRDSKDYSDPQIRSLAKTIKHLPHVLWVIQPLEYNRFYEEYSNLNQILALAHARVIQELIEKLTQKGILPSKLKVLTDQFAKKELLEQALSKQAVSMNLENLEQRVRAESHPAVACASILARENFLESGEQLFLSQNVPFIKGSSDLVVETARKILSYQTHQKTPKSSQTKYSEPILKEKREKKKEEIHRILRPLAKLHFKCTKKIYSFSFTNPFIE